LTGVARASVHRVLDDSSQGKLLAGILAVIAEFERDLIRQRTGDGRKRAMANGVKFGRKPKLSAFQRDEARKRLEAGETLAAVARSYAVDVSTISRLGFAVRYDNFPHASPRPVRGS
jgi:DNA invertase Pin-like site-specific DNA recombinase